MKSIWLRLSLALLLAASIAGCASPGRTPRPIEGTWHLVSVERVYLDGEVSTEWMGKNPKGVIQYHPDGTMSVQFMRAPRPTFTTAQVSDEVRAQEILSAFSGYYAYWGTFEFDEKTWTVKHHVVGSLNPGEVDQTLTRYAKIQGNQLVIHTPVFKRGGREYQNRITFRRAVTPGVA